jgi:hypothetical protein
MNRSYGGIINDFHRTRCARVIKPLKKVESVKLLLLIIVLIPFMLSLYDIHKCIEICKIIILYLMGKDVLIISVIMEFLSRLCARKLKMEHNCKINSVK